MQKASYAANAPEELFDLQKEAVVHSMPPFFKKDLLAVGIELADTMRSKFGYTPGQYADAIMGLTVVLNLVDTNDEAVLDAFMNTIANAAIKPLKAARRNEKAN